MADGASSAHSGASSASSSQTNSKFSEVAYSLGSPAPPSYLDKVDNFVRSAQMYEHLTNYASARQCYEAAADTIMDMLERPDCKFKSATSGASPQSEVAGRVGYRVIGLTGLHSVLSPPFSNGCRLATWLAWRNTTKGHRHCGEIFRSG